MGSSNASTSEPVLVQVPWWRKLPVWLIAFTLCAGAGLLQSMSVDWTRPLTIYDEVPHIDYVFRLADGSLTTWDDVYSQRTLGIADCLEAMSDNPQCVTGELRDPQERWPNGHSYEALQAPVGYLPFVVADFLTIDNGGDHYSQIRQLRLVNTGLWVIFAGAWALLIAQVTSRRLAAAAASVAVAVNPLLFDRFTYVTNDGTAIIMATAISAWLLFTLRRPPPTWWGWLLPALLAGLVLGSLKPTALIVLPVIILAVWATGRFVSSTYPPKGWWIAVLVTGGMGSLVAITYAAYVNSLSKLDYVAVFSLIQPRGPLDFATASLLRIEDVSEVVTGSGARTDQMLFDWGVRSPSTWILAFTLVTAAAFMISLTVRSSSFDRSDSLDYRALGLAVLAGFIAILIALPALHYVRGEFLLPFTSGRFQATLIPLAGLAMLPAFARFRMWALVMVLAGVGIAAFAS